MLDLSTSFATFPVLETKRLVLRNVEPDDALPMFRVMADPLVARFFGSPPMLSVEEAAQRIAEMRNAFAELNGIRWAITSRADGAYLGSCGFWRIVKPHFRAEIGYELAPDWWGQGIMPEAVGAAVAFGFAQMGLHSIEAQIDPDNLGSRRVLEKLGFVQEGYLRESYYEAHNSRFTDTAIFSLLKAGWLEE